MSKRKSSKPRKPNAGTTDVAKPAATPKPAVSAADLAGSEGEELQAAPDTATSLPELPGQEIENELPAVPPAELESEPALSPHLAEPEPDVASAVEVRAEAKVSVDTATVEVRTAGPSLRMDRPLGTIAGIEAYQMLLMEMTRDNLDFAASLAAMRSPLDILDVATKFAGRRIGMYGRFSRAVVDMAAGRQSPMI
jgi:hypothetical protein